MDISISHCYDCSVNTTVVPDVDGVGDNEADIGRLTLALTPPLEANDQQPANKSRKFRFRYVLRRCLVGMKSCMMHGITIEGSAGSHGHLAHTILVNDAAQRHTKGTFC